VRAVVNFYGPSDFIVYLSNNSSNPQAFSHLFGKPWPQSRSIAQLASPASHVGEGDAPMLIIQGTADTLVPPAQSEHLHKRYQQAGLVSQLVMIDGAGHTGPQFTDAVRRRQIRSFLDEHLKGTRSEDRP
jgi:dipeptidyl aminopeptidase/acylaminoacyl peptidase